VLAEGHPASAKIRRTGTDVTLGDVTTNNMTAMGMSLDATMPYPDSDSDEPFHIQPLNVTMASASAAAAGNSHSTVTMHPNKGTSPLVPLFLRRCKEEKAAVKRAALAALCSLAVSGVCEVIACPVLSGTQAKVNEQSHQLLVRSHGRVLQLATHVASQAILPSYSPCRQLGAYALQIVASKATDSSIIVRKAALSTLDTVLGAEGDEPLIQELWLASVLPLLNDVEPTVVARAAEYTHKRVFSALLEWQAASKSKDADIMTADSQSLWALLAGAASNPELTRCMAKAVALFSRVPGSAAAAASKAGGGATVSATLEFPVEKLVSALQLAATRACDSKAAPASQPLPQSDNDSLSLADLDVADPDHARMQLTLRRGSWMLLEQLTCHSASHKPGPGAKSVPAAFVGLVPFVIRSWTSLESALSTAIAGERQRAASRTQASGSFIDTGASPVEALAEDAARCARVLCLLASSTPKEQSHKLAESILGRLRRFDWPSGLTGAAIRAVAAVGSLILF
jgi:hypothetical protein